MKQLISDRQFIRKNSFIKKKKYSEVEIEINNTIMDETSNVDLLNNPETKRKTSKKDFFTGQETLDDIVISKGYIAQNKYDRIYYITITPSQTEKARSKITPQMQSEISPSHNFRGKKNSFISEMESVSDCNANGQKNEFFETSQANTGKNPPRSKSNQFKFPILSTGFDKQSLKKKELELSIINQEQEKSRSNVLIIHGYGSSEHLLDFGIALAKNNNMVHLFDINGFGFSGGKRFNSSNEEIFENFFAILTATIPNKNPLFVIAESYGATFFLNFQILYNINIAGLVLLAPWIKIPEQANLNSFFIKSLFIKLFGSIFDVS